MVAGLRAEGKTSIAEGIDALGLSYSKVVSSLKELGANIAL
jgi:UDP-N-acetylglucosamine enolpyruvyl transferase